MCLLFPGTQSPNDPILRVTCSGEALRPVSHADDAPSQSWGDEFKRQARFSKEIIGDMHLSDHHSFVSVLKCH